MSLATVHIVGAGLIGTSIGLALSRAGVDVTLADPDSARLRLAADLGAGRAIAADTPRCADLAVVCVPPNATGSTLKALEDREVAPTLSDVGSVKAEPQRLAETLLRDPGRYVGGHPLAGRERGGPGMARADLFTGRPWVLTPTESTAPDALATVRELVLGCAAVPVEMGAVEHDAAVALVSHAPQAIASLLAARLVDADEQAVGLVGPGLRDLTRIADSDPELWAQIGAANAAALSAELTALSEDLRHLAAALARGGATAAAAVRDVVARGNTGRNRLPGKHGTTARRYATVAVVIADEPGALARLLLDAGAAGINVEDLRLEHSPGAPAGLCELLVDPAAAATLSDGLAGRGWHVYGGTS